MIPYIRNKWKKKISGFSFSVFRGLQKPALPITIGVLFPFLFLSLSVPAQDYPRSAAELDLLYFRFGTFEKNFDKAADPAGYAYYHCRTLFLKYVFSEKPEDARTFLKAADVAVQTFTGTVSRTVDVQVMDAECRFLAGVVKVQLKEYVSAALDINRSASMITESSKKFPQDARHEKLLGLLNVALSAIPRKLQPLTNLLGFKGDLRTGMQQLKSASQYSDLLAAESEIILFYIEKNLLGRPGGAHIRMESLNKKYPDCFPLRLLYASSHIENHHMALARLILENEREKFASDPDIFFAPLWDYQLGKVYYFVLMLDDAVLAFDAFLQHYEGSSYGADARFRKGIALALSGRDGEATEVFRLMVKKQEGKGSDGGDYALYLAGKYSTRSMTGTEKTLYRARNLFDGGRFREADTELSPLRATASTLSADDRTELHYRSGRIAQSLRKYDEAMTSYRTALGEKPSANLWMKVYAHYYLGKVLEEKKDTEGAAAQYRQALTYNGYFYQSGLEQRCKAALASLGK